MRQRFLSNIRPVIAGIVIAQVLASNACALAAGEVAVSSLEAKVKNQDSDHLPELSDDEIRLSVENELLASQAIKSHRIRVIVEDGIVTLAGRLRNLMDEDIAVGLTRRVRGAESVIDQLEVNRSDRNDSAVLKDVEAALANDPGMRDLKVFAAVKNGTAELTGEVPSYGAKVLVGNVVRGVGGILDLDDKLTVLHNLKLTDADLKQETTELLKYTVELDQIHLEVAVKDGIVVLNGAVTTDFQRSAAEQLAYRVGAKDVDVRGIHVDWKHANPELRTTRYKQVTDEQIREAVTRAFKYDPRVLSFHQDVDVKNGIVTLSGAVEDLAASRAAERAAQFTVGVRQVVNHINVEWTKTAPTDEEIAEYTKAAMHRDPYLDDEEIIVDVENAHVELHGLVESNFERNHAEWTASRQKAVVHVDNYLNVRAKWVPKTDEVIAKALKDQIELMFVNDQENLVTFKVVDGVALMEGSVETWYMWQNVMDAAMTAGAREPHMMIEVRYGTPASLRYSGPHDYVPE